ncbi:MAG TPA: ASCH domain-containing protein [Planctomycetaceae bacterium]|nr:ASCH domain-containing protein [Planctomycetaceae bacterium]
MPAEDRAEFDRDRIALAIQQPWAELILRGIKTLEIRSQPTQLRGTIYLYASKRVSQLAAAKTAARHWKVEVERLPVGKLVGTVELANCRASRPADHQAACVPADLLKGRYVYELSRPERFATPRAVRFLPYGVWFYPFKRRPRTDRQGR